jgi:hypothetical protein
MTDNSLAVDADPDALPARQNQRSGSRRSRNASRRSRRLTPQMAETDPRATTPSRGRSGLSANRSEGETLTNHPTFRSTSRPPLWKDFRNMIVFLTLIMPALAVFWRSSTAMIPYLESLPSAVVDLSADVKSGMIYRVCKLPVTSRLSFCPKLEGTVYGHELEISRQYLKEYRQSLSGSPGTGDQVVLLSYDRLKKVLDEMATIELDILHHLRDVAPGKKLLKRYDQISSPWTHQDTPSLGSLPHLRRDLVDSYRQSNSAMEKMVTRSGILVEEYKGIINNIIIVLGVNPQTGIGVLQPHLGYLHPNLGRQMDTLQEVGVLLGKRYVRLRDDFATDMQIERDLRDETIGSASMQLQGQHTVLLRKVMDHIRSNIDLEKRRRVPRVA